ncbi:histidine phosphatase superfamily [Hyaloraphidium curvatum]|nr:histidine phosphatase superfamily [Hyaloraphidium curvatum]
MASQDRIIVIRHGFRQDWDPIAPHFALHDGGASGGVTPLPAYSETGRLNDPYLSELGVFQAREMARFVAPLLLEPGVGAKLAPGLVLMSSPYLRCVQTSLAILERLYELGVPRGELPRIRIAVQLREWYLPEDELAAPPLGAKEDVCRFLPGADGLIENSEPWIAVPEGETLARTKDQLLFSLKAFSEQLESVCQGRTLICVSHAASIVALVRGFDFEKASIPSDPSHVAFTSEVALDGGMRVHSGVCAANILTRAGPDEPWKLEYISSYLSGGNQKDWEFRD